MRAVLGFFKFMLMAVAAVFWMSLPLDYALYPTGHHSDGVIIAWMGISLFGITYLFLALLHWRTTQNGGSEDISEWSSRGQVNEPTKAWLERGRRDIAG